MSVLFLFVLVLTFLCCLAEIPASHNSHHDVVQPHAQLQANQGEDQDMVSTVDFNADDNALAHFEKNSGVIAHDPMLLSGSVVSLDWYGHNHATAFLVTSTKELFRSVDEGVTWENQASKIGCAEGITEIAGSPADTNMLMLKCGTNGYYVTKNLGDSYKRISVKLTSVKMHPHEPSLILGASRSPECAANVATEKKKKKSAKHDAHAKVASDPHAPVGCNAQLLVSKDFGKTWSIIVTYLVSYHWAPNPSASHVNQVFVTAHRVKTGNQQFGRMDPEIDFISSDDFFETSHVLVPNGNRVAYTEHFVYVAYVKEDVPNEVFMVVNRDNLTSTHFSNVALPFNMFENTFKMLDSSEGSAFLHVTHHELGHINAGNLYISDSTGVAFSLSAMDIASDNNQADFEKINGLEGIFILNVDDRPIHKAEESDEEEETDLEVAIPKRVGPKQEKTLITRDKGSSWEFLNPPKTDFHGDPIHCEHADQCYLHLHFWRGAFGPIYSRSTAVGVVIGVGNVGAHLSYDVESVHTFLSRDGGLTWFHIAKGSHIYELGNHGGLLVMANDHAKTNRLMYSTDEGLTFHSIEMAHEGFHVENIVIEPTNSALVFAVIGHNKGAGVIVIVDFRGLHDESQCNGIDAPDTELSDFETWTPHDSHSNCLLGHVTSYVRRKRDHRCHISKEHNPILKVEHCACTIYDFECDFGYKRDLSEGGDFSKCIPDEEAKFIEDPRPCEGFKQTSKGYRRIAGNTCEGGAEWMPITSPCPVDLPHASHVGLIMLVILAILIAGLCAVTLVNRFEPAKHWFDSVKGRFNYGALPSHAQKRDHKIDTDFGFDDDDMDNSASLIKDDTKFSKPISVTSQPTRVLGPLPPAAVKDVVIPVIAPHSMDDFDPRK